MARGLDARLRALENRWDDKYRYIDAAIRLAVYRRADDEDDETGTPTGQTSDVIGGVWDRNLRRFDPDREPKRVIEAPVSLEQFGYCLDRTTRLMGKGGRGGGKSEALAEKCRVTILQNPLVQNILILSPDYPHTQLMWSKIYRRIQPWIAPGGVHVALRQFHTVFGCVVGFKSAHNAESVRGFGAAVGLLDEEKDISQAAYDNFLLCIRLGGRNPHIAGVGTPEAGGEYEQRWNQFVEDPGAAQHSFPSRSNPFISPAIFELAKRAMDPRRYRQEVLAEFVPMNADEFVFREELDRKKHGIRFPQQWRDITPLVTKRKGYGRFRFIAGADYNDASPNVARIYQVYSPEGPLCKNRWVLRKCIEASGHAGWLAKAMCDAGYNGKNTIVIDDASGAYNAPAGRKDPNASSRLMKKHGGFTCVHPKKNPQVRDRVAAFLAKLNPVEGPHSWFYDTADETVRTRVEQVSMLLRWNPLTGKIDKEAGVDHEFDAMTYPISFFEPAALSQVPGVIGIPGLHAN